MVRSRVVPVGAAAAVTALALAALTVSPAASAAVGPVSRAQTVLADVSSGPFHITVTARRAPNAAADSATGQFAADVSLAGFRLSSLSGPVTCLDVQGHRAGLFYPITSSSPSLFSHVNSGVFIYFQLSDTGVAQSVGFLPVPIASTRSCAPSLALLPVTSGSVTLTS
ncbi:MAG: hypothetical protein M3O28_03080 [Actinomycetota bacterium]|nr:hypothetical protein [Actinomycetota bacterium]